MNGKKGLEILRINFGVMGEPAFPPEITRPEAVKAGGGDLAVLAPDADKDEATRVMAAGLAVAVRRLFDDGRTGRLNRRPAWAAIAVLLSRLNAGR